jgi:AraC-like DNA-binding protein
MPLYMDRHDVSDQVTAEQVAELHQQDLKIQHKFNCTGLTYWFDENRKTAFCLIEAPNEQAIEEMHRQAHGEVPHRIIEVDPAIVESFLGRIEDPQKAKNARLNIINEPAFRTILLLEMVSDSWDPVNAGRYSLLLQNSSRPVSSLIKNLKGHPVKQSQGNSLTSFNSVTNAVECAIQLQTKLSEMMEHSKVNSYLKICICSGVPVTDEKQLFEKTIKTAKRLVVVNRADIIVTPEVKELYLSENQNSPISNKNIGALTYAEETFINGLMAFIEAHYHEEALKSQDICKGLGISKAQLYRKLVALTGKSTALFLRDYRLHTARELLSKGHHNISEVTFMTGFNSPSYFAKCFSSKYGILPSDYINKSSSMVA